MCPAIYDTHVVYQDNRNGNWDIYRYNYYRILKARLQIIKNKIIQFGKISFNFFVEWWTACWGSHELAHHSTTQHDGLLNFWVRDETR